ncbi:MAG: histidine phosphatase family protein [Acidimicrobiia bacterium]|nr:histidine phosphatase family protein [Acidimicrobiia bacterium]
MSIYLIRHASAGTRGRAEAPDLHRPLDDYGRQQADAIAARLAQTALEAVLSSAALRCIQTVAPLAALHGVEVETHPALLEGADLAATLDLIESCAHRTVALCSHGDVIPEVMQLLANRGVQIGNRRGFAKGGIWTLDGDGSGDGVISRAVYESTVIE